jgi:(p)ppGpp synthase/HD superfamily hydrolase
MALSERFEEALVFAARAHAEQVRKGTPIPYAAHLLAVAALVLEHGGSEEEAIAALLHDAIEDQGGTAMRERLRERFGEAVVRIVDGCTDAEVLPKPPWRARKEAYLAHLAHASPATVLVSAADKVHNARAVLGDYRRLGEGLWGRFTGGRDGTLWYYRALVEAYRSLDLEPRTRPLVEELDRTVTELERLAGVNQDG